MRINYSFWVPVLAASIFLGGVPLLALGVLLMWFEDYQNRVSDAHRRDWAVGRLYQLHKKGV